jgi:hypothetical protein
MEIGVPAAARELGITEEAIRVKLRNGELGGRKIRVGRRDRWFVDRTDVDTWRRRRDVLEGPATVSSPVQDQVPQQVHQMAVPVGGGASATGKLQGRADPASSRITGVEVDLRDVALDLDELVRLRREVAVLRATLWELLNPER